MKSFVVTLALACASLMTASAEGGSSEAKRESAFLKHLDIAVTGGTTGIGFDLAAPVNEMVQLRTGMSFMPNFDYNMTFGLETYGYSDANASTSRFGKMAELMKTLSGCEVDDRIDVVGEPKYYNFKLLVDVFPFKKKEWHLTAGFYWGPSVIAKAVNVTEEMPSLVAVKMYNNMYDYIMDEKYWDTPIYGDIFLDPAMAAQLADRFSSIGRVGVNLGTRVSDGTPYMLEPDANGMVSTKVRTNAFKPYLGFGYGQVTGENNRTFNVSFDCGLMFWGGTPEIITHDGTNLAKDVRNVKGKVGDYVKLIKAFKVFPVIDLRVAYRLF